MEEVDDDFGDLYADVQIPATSSFNPSPDFSHLYNTQRTHSPLKKNADSSRETPAHSGNAFEGKFSSQESHLLAAYDSDTSHDDLKIILNDDRNAAAPVASVNGGLDTDEKNGDFDGYDDAGELQRTNNWLNPDDRALSPNGAKTDYVTGHLHYKYSNLHRESSKSNGLSASAEGEECLLEPSASAVAQNCSTFSLPRYRTIFDVNMDTIDSKPWTLPGADASNYFNFGFDEESWKHYCNQLDNFRRLKSTLSDHSSRIKAYEVGASAPGEELIEASSSFLKESQGRVIQIGDGTFERLPSIDTKWPTDRDSEAIQIVLKDFVEDSSSKTALVEKETVIDVLVSNQHKIVDWNHDENPHPHLSNSKGKAEPTQMSDDSIDKDDKDSCKTVLSMEGMGSLLQEPSLSSPSPSSSGIHCASKDTVSNKKVKSCLNKQKSVDHEYYGRKRSRRSPVSRNLVDHEYYDRKRSRRSPFSRNLEHYSREGYRSSERKNSSTYDSEVIYNLYHFKTGNTRQDHTRVYKPNCYDREDAMHHNKRYAHLNSNNAGRSWRDEGELLLLRRWNDNNHLPTRNLSNYIGGLIENPPKRKEHRKMFPNNPPSMDIESSHWRKNGDRFQFREATTEEDERYGFYDKKRKFLDGKYESPYMNIGEAFFDESDYRRYPNNRNPHPSIDWDNLDRHIQVDRSRERVQYRHLDDDFPGEGRLRYPYIDAHSERRILNPRWRDDDLPSEEALFSVERSSKQHATVSRQWKSVNDRVERWQGKFNEQIGEGNSGYHLQRNPITSHDDNHKESPSKCVDSQFNGVRGKFCRRRCGSGHINLHDRKAAAEIQRDYSAVNKMNWVEKYPATENNIECSSDVEEGQIVTEELLEETKPRNQPIDEQRIVEMRAKMMKRRERFMDVTNEKKNEANMKQMIVTRRMESADTKEKQMIVTRRMESADTKESGGRGAEPNKQERPVRKRRWGGN